MSKGLLLTIGEASHILGVSEATLRQWTDNGKVKAFVTPGGHRRYSRAELAKLTGAHRYGIKELIKKMETSQHLQIVPERLARVPWYKKLGVKSRRKLGEFGREILDLAVAYISRRRQRGEISKQAKKLGGELGKYLAESGLSLTDSLKAFLLYRAPVADIVLEVAKGGGILSQGVVEVMPEVNQLLDDILLSLVSAYQGGKGRKIRKASA